MINVVRMVLHDFRFIVYSYGLKLRLCFIVDGYGLKLRIKTTDPLILYVRFSTDHCFCKYELFQFV